MRTIDDIEADLNEARSRCKALEVELNAAKLQAYLQASGVPDGARPVFANRKGERVLVTGFESFWPMGQLIKKDGTVSTGTVRRLYDGDGYHYVGEARP